MRCTTTVYRLWSLASTNVLSSFLVHNFGGIGHAPIVPAPSSPAIFWPYQSTLHCQKQACQASRRRCVGGKAMHRYLFPYLCWVGLLPCQSWFGFEGGIVLQDRMFFGWNS